MKVVLIIIIITYLDTIWNLETLRLSDTINLAIKDLYQRALLSEGYFSKHHNTFIFIVYIYGTRPYPIWTL